jgi:hypothetical protein
VAQRLPEPSPVPDNVRELRLNRHPKWQWPLSVVLLGAVLSLGIVAANHFRRGSVLLAAFVWLGFFLRLLLSDADAGLLTVRSKRTDLVVLLTLAMSVSLLALAVPPPS